MLFPSYIFLVHRDDQRLLFARSISHDNVCDNSIPLKCVCDMDWVRKKNFHGKTSLKKSSGNYSSHFLFYPNILTGCWDTRIWSFYKCMRQFMNGSYWLIFFFRNRVSALSGPWDWLVRARDPSKRERWRYWTIKNYPSLYITISPELKVISI